MDRSTLINYLNTLLSIKDIDDFSYNGLQFEGCSDIQRIGFAVDAGIGTFKQAAEEKLDMLIVHHGLFWKKANPVITGVHKKRLQILWENDLNLFAVHLPLDMHQEVGNNAGLIKLLGGEVVDGFSDYGRSYIGSVGELPEEMSLDSLSLKLSEMLNAEMRTIQVNDKPITKIATLSGACSRPDLYAAASKGADLFITGEPMELYHDAHDYDINVLFAGHHASETVGINLLKEKIERQFPELETVFLSHPTNL